MPDILAGDTSPSAAIVDDSTSILEQVKIKAAEVTKSFMIDMWLARVTDDKIMPVLHKVIEAANEQYADAVKAGDGIYAVGYCIGGRFVMLLGKETKVAGGDEESGKTAGPYIRAGAVAHAASVVPDDFQDVKVPLTFVCVENDPLFPDEVRTGGEDVMSDANLEHEVQVYPGVPHGKSCFFLRKAALTRCRVCRRGRISRPVHPGCTGHGLRANVEVGKGSLRQGQQGRTKYCACLFVLTK